MASKVAVIGCGISGAVCASILAKNGLSVTIFESARGPGGRMSQRRERFEDGKELMFDHGAPCFAVNASNLELQSLVNNWESRGLVAQWKEKFGSFDCKLREFICAEEEVYTRYVGVPGMNSVCKALCLEPGIEPRFGHGIGRLDWLVDRNTWSLTSMDGKDVGHFMGVVATDKNTFLSRFTDVTGKHPPIDPNMLSEVGFQIKEIPAFPCFALMLAFSQPLSSIPMKGGFSFKNSDILSWAYCDSSKPGRSTTSECWVLHSTAKYAELIISQAGFQKPSTALLTKVADELFQEFQSTGTDIPQPFFKKAHRWCRSHPNKGVEAMNMMNGLENYLSQDSSAIRQFCSAARVEEEEEERQRQGEGEWYNELDFTTDVDELVDTFFNVEYCEKEKNAASEEEANLPDFPMMDDHVYYESNSSTMDDDDLTFLIREEEKAAIIAINGVDQGLQLVHLLLACAEAVGCRDAQLADSILTQIWPRVTPWGDSLQRVSQCFAVGLKSRLSLLHNVNPNGSFSTRAIPNFSTATAEEKTEALDLLHQTTPYIAFAFVSANHAICHAASAARKESLHIIDLGMEHDNLQWPSLLSTLSLSSRRPKRIRITGFVGDRDPTRIEIGMGRLAGEAAALGISLEYSLVREGVSPLRSPGRSSR